jgi:hypothetical protein
VRHALAHDLEYRVTLRQADQTREDFAAIRDELDWLSRMRVTCVGSVWALLAVIAVLLAG